MVHILDFEILQTTWKNWKLRVWCFLLHFFMWFARFQTLVFKLQSIWCKASYTEFSFHVQFQYRKKNEELTLCLNSNQLSTWAHKCHFFKVADWRLLTFVIYCFASFALGLVFILPNGSQILQNTHYAVEASSILLSFIMVCMYFSKFGLLGLCKDCRNFCLLLKVPPRRRI